MEIMGPTIAPISAYDQLGGARQAFVDAFVLTGDIWKAWQQVYPTSSDRPSAHRWAKDPLLIAAVAERMTQYAAQRDITLPRVIAEIGALAFSNMRNYVRLEPLTGLPYFDFREVTDEQWAAVKEFTVEEDVKPDGNRVRKVKMALHDKPGSLDKLMKRFGAYAPQVIEHKGLPGGSNVTVNMNANDAAAEYAKLLSGESE